MRPTLKITPSIVLASAAVVIASGGSAYAATKIGSAEIRDNSIRGVDIKDNTVRGRDITNGTLRAKDFAPGTLRTGPRGSTGPRGATGMTGPQGPAGASRWLLVDANGEIVAQSGGFSINAAYPTLENTAVSPAPDNSLRAAGNVYINAHEDLSNNAVTVSIALQNSAEQNANGNVNGRASGPDVNPEFSGEITSSVCGVTGVVACAPPGANNRSHLVVSPRMSDGSLTFGSDPVNSQNTHKRFYVSISGDSSDLVGPTPAIPAVALP